MRTRLLNAPAWALAVLNGTLFGLGWVLFTRVGEGESWTASFTYGGIMGVLFGAVMGPIQHRQFRGLRDAAARSPEGLSARVRRAASRGPVREDPEVRAAAHDVAVAQLAPLESQRIWAPVFFLLLAVLGIVLAVTGTPWWWLAVVAWLGAAAGHRYVLLRQRRRAELLSLQRVGPADMWVRQRA